MREYLSWHSPRFAWAVASLASRVRYRPFAFAALFWKTRDITGLRAKNKKTPSAVVTALFLQLGIFGQYVVAGASLGFGLKHHLLVLDIIGALLLASAPIVWPYVLFVTLLIIRILRAIMRPVEAARELKEAGKHVLCSLLENQVVRLRNKHAFKVIAVAGSIGKTSTKLAIVSLLKNSRLVQYQDGNYNDRLTVPLIFFGNAQPALYNVFAWLGILLTNEMKIYRRYPYDFVVVELGTDGVGQMARFAYLKPELGILTAIAPEHMEMFGDLDTVAKEELEIAAYAKRLLVNSDDCDRSYIEKIKHTSYGLGKKADYRATQIKAKRLGEQTAQFLFGSSKLSAGVKIHGKQGVKVCLAALAVGDMLGLTKQEIEAGLEKITPQPGRMNILAGIKNTTIIDDSYNSSPVAVKAALAVLYGTKTSQRIAVLGSMNEMGDYAQQAHEDVATYCDPSKLDLLVTVGITAKELLAPVARQRGCTVESFLSPYEAGEYVQQHIQEGAVVLVKGSQNGVFTEETIKLLLAHPQDAQKLVRQSPSWMKTKHKQFNV